MASGVTTLYFYDPDGRLLEEYIPATGEGKDYVWLPGIYEPLARVDFAMSDTDNGNVLRVTKSSPNVHLDWSLDGTSGPFVLKRSISFTFSSPPYFGPAQTAKTFDDGILSNTTNYAYEAFRRTLTDTLYFYHPDHLGTPIAMSNTSGALVWRAEHTPFGGIYALTVGTITNNLRFPGQYWDGETGLAQNLRRDYSSALGRYYQPDPVFWEIPKTRRYKRAVEQAIYAKMRPIISIDPKGLTELVGFPAGSAASLGSSLINAIRGLKRCCDCMACKDAANQLLRATIYFQPRLEDCGATWQNAQSAIYGLPLPWFAVGPGTLPGGHCCTAQTFAEEALHLAGLSDSNNEAGQVAARCVPCR